MSNAPKSAAGARHAGGTRGLAPWTVPFALVNGAALGITPILLPLAVAGSGAGRVGMVMGAYNLGALAAPAAGAIVDRWRAHRLLATGCAALVALTMVLFPFADVVGQLLLALVEGAAVAGAMTVANLLIVERTPSGEWNARLSALETMLGAGQAVALLLAGVLAGLDVRTGLWIGAIVPAAAAPLAWFLVPDVSATHAPPGAATLTDSGHAGEWGPASPTRSHHRLNWRSLRLFPALFTGRFRWFLLAWIPAYAAAAVVFSLYPVLFQHAFAVAPSRSSLAFAIIVVLSLPVYSLAGWLAQHWGVRAALLTGVLIRLVALGGLAAVAIHAPGAEALAFVAFSGLVFGWSFLSVATPALTGLLVPQAPGEAQGLLNATNGLAGLLGGVSGGLVAERWGYGAALSAATVALTLALFLFVVAGQSPKRTGGAQATTTHA